jgi:hypothetical protein
MRDGPIMRSMWRRTITLVALYAVSLHIVLLGFLPAAAAGSAPVDSFAIICHTIAPSQPGEPPQGSLQYLPGRAIDHCDLASAVGLPPSPEEFFKVDLRRTCLVDVLRPHTAPEQKSLVYPANLIRGPPQA